MSHAVVDNGDIQLTDLLNGMNTSGTWADGTLTLKLKDLMTDGKAQDFNFQFTVKNPNYPVSTPPTITMTSSLVPLEHCQYDKTGQTFMAVMTTPTVCAHKWDFAGGNEVDVSSTTTSTLTADKTAGELRIVTTKTRAADGQRLNGTCLGCCHKEVCTNITTGKSEPRKTIKKRYLWRIIGRTGV